ncbi:hypothetical protein K7395_24750 [Streptomyces filamentosus]|uniref:Scaffolding protein n=2 Tax=Streptomyces filamentosus TaxID=67294 RepID=A0ABY4UZJ9_STRFL|nr:MULTISPECIES: hypothetical protein [Streptomyces]EFE74569.1 conserved hypothetical protein [Streptomyces filamentosus NRRL 15998]ESU46492.1 hypothetical protein P376_5528 [Streptomyces sp. HCCB10043]EWS91669.1 hypothetical protein SSIG_02116 [Streptomyces filamentosus NRRL 11379]MYR78697.1 hypothetical protein [Streptomyces sp. SID5466]USC49699.1 hypothetical protein K7395_24750 [Streptomyces filamentosus]
MRARTLPTLPGIRSGWLHLYPSTPFSPFHADGGEGGEGDGKGGKPEADDKGGKGEGADDKSDTGDSEAEKHKALSRKWEARAKENAAKAKELDELKAANATETEKAIAEAVKSAVAEERSAGAAKLARQVFLAGAAGRLESPADVVEDVNLSKYIDANGDVDEDGLAKLIDRLAPKSKGDGEGSEGDGGDQGGGGDTRRRTRGTGYQGTRQRNGGGSGGSVAEGRDLYKQLLGGGDKT